MSSRYIYRKPVRRSRYADFRRRLFVAAGIILPIAAVVAYILSNSHGLPGKPSSGTEISGIAGTKLTFTGPYFQFQDTGKWSLDKADTTANRFVYLKYNKSQLQHELDIFVNDVPPPLFLDVPRALPVRIVNDNSLNITNVSSPCGSLYAAGELHKVKELQVNNATILCDPDNSQYYVILSEINGDYRLNMKRSDGTPIQFVITYKDVGLEPQPDSLLNIAGSFRAL